jgi:hypothetical protein
MDRSQGNPTYTATTLSEKEMVDNLMLVKSSFFLPFVKDEIYNTS